MIKTRAGDVVGSGSTKAGWRVKEWAADVGVSRSYVFNLIATNSIKSVKVGTARVITTTPRDYLAELAGEVA